MNFAYSIFLLFMPSWCGGITYQEWLKYMNDFWLQCSKHLTYEFHISIFLLFMPSWCGGITYHEWLKYRGFFSPLTMIGNSYSWCRIAGCVFQPKIEWNFHTIRG